LYDSRLLSKADRAWEPAQAVSAIAINRKSEIRIIVLLFLIV
jgi:hypothetical protein